MTLLFTDDLFLEHRTHPGHPERPARLEAIRKRLERDGLFERCERGKATPLDREALTRVHSEEQIRRIEELCERGGGRLDPDTPVSPRSLDAARLAAGCGVAAVDAVLAGRAPNALCLVRPPGHHATPTRSMGFCLVNHLALAAHHALTQHQLSRVLVVDWDVHHGNGTQDIFYEDPRVLFFSAHRYPFYPGTGAANDTGAGRGLGYTLNMPVAYGTRPTEYRKRFESHLASALAKIEPELVLVSAGFDAHRLDPIGSLDLEIEDFHELGRMVLDAARSSAKGKLVSFLEGGYDVDVLAECVAQLLEQLIAAG